MEANTSKRQVFIGVSILILLALISFWILISLWRWFAGLNSDLEVGMLTASSTVIVATVTLVLGRYFERIKEAESHLRSQKIEMYDDFLKELFASFHDEEDSTSDELVHFLQDWQRKLVVWARQ